MDYFSGLDGDCGADAGLGELDSGVAVECFCDGIGVGGVGCEVGVESIYYTD